MPLLSLSLRAAALNPPVLGPLAVQPPIHTEAWFGPAEIRFKLPSQGNPYSPRDNDVKVKFVSGNHSESRIAFFDGTNWRCRILTRWPGVYHASVYRNGQFNLKLSTSVPLRKRLAQPFVRIVNHRFQLTDGQPYWPVGHSLAWTNPDLYPSLTAQMEPMANAGINWTRIWSTYWDDRNPYWTKADPKPQDGWFSQPALARWDAITRTAEKTRIYFQWTLHHHGQVSTEVNPNWQDHPWNVKNGGFLATAEEFFTNPEAKRRTRAYLRYVVARYADSPAILAWELFNEVQFSDAARHGHWDTVCAWHDEMAKYVRSIDPYHHLITTSSELEQPMWSQMDYTQAHGYPSSVRAMVLATRPPSNKPFFFGEVGIDGGQPSAARERSIVRDSIWCGLLAGDPGSAEYWGWDSVWKYKLYGEYKRSISIVHKSGFLGQTQLSHSRAAVSCPAGGVLTFAPGLGWTPTLKSTFHLPADAAPEGAGQMSGYLQGTSHPEMKNGGYTFDWTAVKEGDFTIKISDVSNPGATLVATLDGNAVKREDFAGGSHPNETWRIHFGVGRHLLVLKNVGSDWIKLDSFSVGGIAPSVEGSMIGNKRWALVRLLLNANGPTPYQLNGLPVADGTYRLTFYDLDSDAQSSRVVRVKAGKLPSSILKVRDEILVLSKN